MKDSLGGDRREEGQVRVAARRRERRDADEGGGSESRGSGGTSLAIKRRKGE